MSGSNNVTVAMPGHDNWGIWWQTRDLESVQLDIVGFLAVLGEGAVLANAQVSALSRLFILPRLLPAPQALIRTTRPTNLPPTDGKVTGVYSGNVKDHVHHIAHVLLCPDDPDTALAPYTVRCVNIESTDLKVNGRRTPSFLDKFLRGQPTKCKATNAVANKAETRAPLVKAKATGPQTWVTLLGFSEVIVLFIASIVFGDGMSLLATISLSLVSSIVGICNKWCLTLPKATTNPTKGDVVIRYPNGSYLVVKCEESVARALYFAPEEINYYIESPAIYRLLSLVATILLMLGIVFLANSKLQLQLGWAGAYVLINIAHWIAAALPQKYHWDFSCFKVTEQGILDKPTSDNFTEALWKAILVTQSAQWVEAGDAAPKTPAWKMWLDEAETEAKDTAKYRLDDDGHLVSPRWPGEKGEARGKILKAVGTPPWDAKAAWSRCLNTMNNSAPL